jgi:DNA-binding transcriptional LysR family regulator
MFDHIVIFVQLVTIGGFSKAADFLNIAPSTLSRKIQELEAYFGKILIIRDTRNFSLTVDGDTIYQEFKNLPNKLLSIKEKFSPVTEANDCSLNVVLPMIYSLELITPHISYFNKTHPHIKLNLFYTNRKPHLRKKTIDVAVTVYPDNSGKFDQQLLRSEFVQFYCTTSYATKYGLPLTVNNLHEHSVIGGIDFQDNIINYSTLTNKYTNETFIYDSTKDHIKINSPIHALNIGLNGEHLFACWSYLCDDMVKSGKLIRVLPEFYSLKSDLFLLTRKNPGREIRNLADFIHHCINEIIHIDHKLVYVANN